MGRRKNYDREAVIGKAVDLFRKHGFQGTSADMLVEASGLNRFSLYAEFGSKQGLFDAALARYNDDTISLRFGPLETPEAGIAEIRTLLRFYGAASDGPAAGLGCLLCNTAVEFGPLDPGGTDAVPSYFRRLSGAFLNALGNARSQGVLKPDVDPAAEAEFLTAAVLGLFVLLRAKAPPAMISNASEVALAHIDTLCAQSPPV